MKIRVTVEKHIYGFVDVDIPKEEWVSKDTYRKKLNIAREYAKKKTGEILWYNWDPLIGYNDYDDYEAMYGGDTDE